MMDSEIELPIYSEVLGRLKDDISAIPGPVVDTSCGSGHMLARFHEHFDSERPLKGIDLSPQMVALAGERLGTFAKTAEGDMRDLHFVASGSCAAVISFFAIHHLDPDDVRLAMSEWYRVLSPGGRLLMAAWEGEGAIDYGDTSDVVALRYRQGDLADWADRTGFMVSRSAVAPVDEMPMDAVYLEASKGG